MLLVADFVNPKWCEKSKNDRNPGKWVLIWESSSSALLWIPTWQGLDGFQKSLHPCALDENSLSIGRVKSMHVYTIVFHSISSSVKGAVGWI